MEKEALNPSLGKIGIAILLLIISVFIAGVITVIFYMFENLAVYIILLLILLAFSYYLACYISETKKWFAGIGYTILFSLITIILFILILTTYNKLFGYSCNTDQDCIFECPAGAVNKYNIIGVPIPMFTSECGMVVATAICENKRCKTFYSGNAKTIEDCNKFKEFEKDRCYAMLARKQKDKTICEKISNTQSIEQCLKIYNETIVWGV